MKRNTFLKNKVTGNEVALWPGKVKTKKGVEETEDELMSCR